MTYRPTDIAGLTRSLCHTARSGNRPSPNGKRVYRVMKVHGMLLLRYTSSTDTRRHDARVAIEQFNLRWFADGFEIG